MRRGTLRETPRVSIWNSEVLSLYLSPWFIDFYSLLCRP